VILALMIAAAEIESPPADAEETACYERDYSQQAMNRCAGEAYERADKALNAQWKKLVTHYGGESTPARLLRDSQRAWLKYRDAHCELNAYDNVGGSIYPLVVSGCLADLTRKRTSELADLIGPEGQ
jgi:uncharacterized protein YecT (DUF1311 family)